MDLQDLRSQINKIDDELIRLFEQRMDVSVEIARYKRRHNIPIYDPVREREILGNISRKAGEGRKSSVNALYSLLFELSRFEQEKMIRSEVD
jgi:chorismate mutase/prephenate dehydratase